MKKAQGFILKTYPFKEADRVVILFTREVGILRGVARGSLKMKSKITGALEPLTQVNLRYVEPHGKDLVIVTGCDPVRSVFLHMSTIDIATATGLICELTLESHADLDPDESTFRLLELCQRALIDGIDPWLVMHYFELFTLKLTGILPTVKKNGDNAIYNLMRMMLTTNLFDLKDVDKATLDKLGEFLRRYIYTAVGKKLKSYAFLDKISSD